MDIHKVRRTFCEVRRTYLDSYEIELLIAFIVRPITCPHLLHTGVEVGQVEPIKAEYQRERKWATPRRSRESILSGVGEPTPSLPSRGQGCDYIAVREWRITSLESYLCEINCSFVVITLVHFSTLSNYIMKFLKSLLNNMCLVIETME